LKGRRQVGCCSRRGLRIPAHPITDSGVTRSPNWPPIGEATVADSISDRLVHNAHRIKGGAFA